MKKDIEGFIKRFLDERHSCRRMKSALKDHLLFTNGVGCFIWQADYDSFEYVDYCPFCGKKFKAL